MLSMADILAKKIKKLKTKGLTENEDFRVMYFGNWFEIKFIKN